jgi:transposase
LPARGISGRRARAAASSRNGSTAATRGRFSDLPAHGRRVRIALTVRRFRCGNDVCPRVIFAERFGDDIVAPYARRTARLQTIVHHLGLALGGRPGQGLARRLLMPVSKDTLLRTVRARAPEARRASRVIGIDDWAWKRGHRYGSIVCDLERREIVDVLPDRKAATVEAWWRIIPRSRLCRGIAGAAMARRLPARRRMWSRSPIAGT